MKPLYAFIPGFLPRCEKGSKEVSDWNSRDSCKFTHFYDSSKITHKKLLTNKRRFINKNL